jgi:hypothetical protein
MGATHFDSSHKDQRVAICASVLAWHHLAHEHQSFCPELSMAMKNGVSMSISIKEGMAEPRQAGNTPCEASSSSSQDNVVHLVGYGGDYPL